MKIAKESFFQKHSFCFADYSIWRIRRWTFFFELMYNNLALSKVWSLKVWWCSIEMDRYALLILLCTTNISTQIWIINGLKITIVQYFNIRITIKRHLQIGLPKRERSALTYRTKLLFWHYSFRFLRCFYMDHHSYIPIAWLV